MTWWFDALLVGLVLLLIAAGWWIRRQQVGDYSELDPESALAAAESPPARFSLYPKRWIRQAGLQPDRIMWVYWGTKLAAALILPLVLLETLPVAPVWTAVLLGVFAFFAIDLWILLRRRQRKHRIGNAVSFFIDLMVAFLHSGMNVTDAFRRAARYGLPHRNPLSEEVRLAALEMEAGRERQAALHSLGERTGVRDLNRLATVMKVGLQVGSPVSDTLEMQADLMRLHHEQEATKLVNRRSIAALFPLLLVSLPMFLVLVFFPAAIKMMELFRAFSG